MLKSSTIIAIACLCCFWVNSSLAKTNPPYALKTLSVGTYTGGTDKSKEYDVLRLYNTKTHKTIWTRRLRHDSERRIAWSTDGLALAIYLRWDKILIWRLGYRTRFYDAPRDEDYIMGFLWSPDRRRLLIHAGHSGADMTPTSHLFCLKIRKRQIYSIAKGVARVGSSKAIWVDAQRVRYRLMDYDNKKEDWVVGKPQLWRSP